MTKKISLCVVLSLLLSLMVMPLSAADSTNEQNGILMLAAADTAVNSVNTFNRLLRKPTQKNAPPAEDGIHDPENDGTYVLQPPKVAFEGLPESTFGNYIDWVATFRSGKIQPRLNLLGEEEEPLMMDLDIIREVKSTVPDVVFPHQAHTEWLHCSNCHPDIFIPEQGANRMNMSAILLGQKCGVCHGKVAFPVTTLTCKTCHSKKKPEGWKPPKSQASQKNPWL
jgi:c(7)-type cytochrome triheme protein